MRLADVELSKQPGENDSHIKACYDLIEVEDDGTTD
jgi:hypothetical protein